MRLESQQAGGYHTAGRAQDRAGPRVGSHGSIAEEHPDWEGWPKMSLNLALRDEIQQMKGDRQMGKC